MNNLIFKFIIVLVKLKGVFFIQVIREFWIGGVLLGLVLKFFYRFVGDVFKCGDVVLVIQGEVLFVGEVLSGGFLWFLYS